MTFFIFYMKASVPVNDVFAQCNRSHFRSEEKRQMYSYRRSEPTSLGQSRRYIQSFVNGKEELKKQPQCPDT